MRHNVQTASIDALGVQEQNPIMFGPVRLTDDLIFPPASWARRDGLIAVGGDLRPERLILAYRSGIFPWPFDEDSPLLWFSPGIRMVLPIEALHVSHSLRKVLRRKTFRVTLDEAFSDVIHHCAHVSRGPDTGTWITPAMIEAYTILYRLGLAHSVEVWHQDQIVGGLYGVSLGAGFFGESMFSLLSNASKVGFVTLVQFLAQRNFHFVDCQLYTNHLANFGAQRWRRTRFLKALEHALSFPTLQGPWTIDP
ncbi:MAG: Leucyl/phenylalanyl-tRNA--protein transferase [Deltaproteobacteria bacterium ADurb.Bin207]|nr:MAG: Leucyl/phenylalanyl-tRNA--protein transferase [Deltaproteobacteria bacterium ADurb.Bin207]